MANEVDMFEVMREKVLRGEEIVVNGELGNINAQLHGAMIDRLLRETKQPIKVLHLPASA